MRFLEVEWISLRESFGSVVVGSGRGVVGECLFGYGSFIFGGLIVYMVV